MDFFGYRQDQLYAEDVPVLQIAQRFGTPCYVYSRATIERHWNAFDRALAGHPHSICYAVKANSNLAVLNVLARLGSGFDIVSEGELERVLRAQGDPAKIVFSGVGKRHDELRRALEANIRCFNVESGSELERLNQIARDQATVAPVAVRVNPDVDANTHPYIATGLKENKFGVEVSQALQLYRRAAALSHVEVVGLDCHIGSQLISLDPFLDALDRILVLVHQLERDGIELSHLDLGGGLGIVYRDESPPLPREYAEALLERLNGTPYEIILEPGRAITGNAGILVTRIEYLKPTAQRNFALVDAAMNDLMRPALYGAWQQIIPVVQRENLEPQTYDVVGPVCETGDFLGRERELRIREGDLLAIRSAGAYGFSMSSNYNSRPRPVEVMVDHDHVHCVRQRESIDQLMAGEVLLPA